MKEEITINTEFITLGQLIKLANVLETGGMIKTYLQDVGVIVNGEKEHRRGRKLYPGDEIQIEEAGTIIVGREKD
ncbi:S4 domain-containing protein YaaA [Virgibacillus sp. MSJ-26]|uniref:S4 domain-containing protein YaaA n=1 Tax=Virgibacillus sp. MSJ-26 TaxID=2841522 RepID=UPI001C12548B|nr:S4 domain-containing protein YaaA [Virgibacillus sp. MSJ-26]MBU5467458.1 S4 domain-containing protein YaaA [Virgibacillus sp. MSJ-26]